MDLYIISMYSYIEDWPPVFKLLAVPSSTLFLHSKKTFILSKFPPRAWNWSAVNHPNIEGGFSTRLWLIRISFDVCFNETFVNGEALCQRWSYPIHLPFSWSHSKGVQWSSYSSEWFWQYPPCCPLALSRLFNVSMICCCCLCVVRVVATENQGKVSTRDDVVCSRVVAVHVIMRRDDIYYEVSRFTVLIDGSAADWGCCCFCCCSYWRRRSASNTDF